jgi:hypothetical protein
MIPRMNHRPRLTLILAALGCSLASPVWPNGGTFFSSQEIPGHPSYVLFGTVKDEHGRYLEGVTVRVHVAEHMIDVEARTDAIGRYRMPDVGRVINDMGYETDPKLITVSVDYPGYHIAHREYRGRYRQNKGAIEVDFRLKKNGAG